MTRMLCKILAILALGMSLYGCSLFQSSDDTVSANEIDSQSLADDSQLTGLDLEEEMKAENDDLSGDALGDDSFSESSFEDSGALTDDALDEEFSEADFSDSDFADTGFAEDDFSDQSIESEFSDTNQSAIDEYLVEDELGGFEDFAAAPVIDEPAPEEPIIDIPESDSVLSPVAMTPSNQVTNLEYKAFENGGTVVIETSEPTTFEKTIDPGTNQVIIRVDNVSLPERFKRPYITKDFKQDVATINAYQDDLGGARFVLQMKRPVDPTIEQQGNSILVMTSQGAGLMQAGSVEQPLDQMVDQNQMDLSVTNSSIRQNQDFGSNQTVFQENGQTKADLDPTKFTGEKISLEFIDTDVRQIIETISQRTGVNLIMDKEVGGATSVRLREVPWDQALLVILRSQGLGYVKQGNVLRIARQDTLSKEANQVSEQIASEKKAKQLAGGIKVKYLPVSYAKVSDLAKKLKDFTSKDGKVAFDDRTSSLVITDYGEYVERIEALVKALDTAPMQVEIEAKLVEAREDFIRDVGINWNMNGQAFDIGSQSGTINAALSSTQASTGLSLDLDVGTFDIFGDLSATLQLYENQNKIKVLSQPKIMTVNKVKAEIEQITQVPIVTTVVNGNVTTQTVQFQDLKLGLGVTPQITFKGDVILEVELNREFAGQMTDNGQRELNKRKAKTTVMVKSGKTAVIGGIYQLDDNDIETGVPLLKDIPLLGALFRQERVEKIKNELLLFLKPSIFKQEEQLVSSAAPVASGGFDPFEELVVDEGSDTQESFAPAIQPSSNEGDFVMPTLDAPTSGGPQGTEAEQELDDFDSLELETDESLSL